jgi:hypothetical protein
MTIYKITYSEAKTLAETCEYFETSIEAALKHFTDSIEKHIYPANKADMISEATYNLQKFANKPLLYSGDSETIIVNYSWYSNKDEGSFEVEFPTELTIYRTGEEVAI